MLLVIELLPFQVLWAVQNTILLDKSLHPSIRAWTIEELSYRGYLYLNPY